MGRVGDKRIQLVRILGCSVGSVDGSVSFGATSTTLSLQGSRNHLCATGGLAMRDQVIDESDDLIG
jgi:hypothetical protein